MKNILIVDDEPDIREILRYNLEKAGFNITEAVNGDDALDKVSKDLDLAILDIMMPGRDGYEVCRKIREQGNTVPIVFLTAMDREFDEVRGLEVGGDDYVRKPFSPRMLIARINAILRRVDQISSKGTSISFGDLEINTLTYIAKLEGNELHLPRKEFELLALLTSQPGKVFKREDILDKVWGNEVVVGGRTIDVHIRKLREKIGDKSFKTVKGVGYKFVE